MALNQKTVSDIADLLGMPEVLTQFLDSETPEEEVNPFADALTGVHVFRQEELATRIANESKPLIEDAVRIAKGNTFGTFDKRIKQETGIDKLPNESTIEYLGRATKATGTPPADESETLKTLRTELQAKEELLRTKEQELQTATTKLAGMEVEYATKLQQTQINALIDAAINAVKIEAPTALLAGQRELLKFKFDQRYEAKIVEGKTIYVDKSTGKEKRDTKLANPMSAEEIINEFAPTVVSVKNVQKAGTGLNNAAPPIQPGTEDLAQFADIAAYKKHLTENGITLISEAGKAGIDRHLAYQKSKK